MVPLPLAWTHSTSKLLHSGQKARGYQITVLQALQRTSISRPSVVASQNGFVSTLIIGEGAGRVFWTVSVMRPPGQGSAWRCPYANRWSHRSREPAQFDNSEPGLP